MFTRRQLSDALGVRMGWFTRQQFIHSMLCFQTSSRRCHFVKHYKT